MTDDTLRCATPEEFAAWLEANHRTATGVWLALPKKGTAVPSVTRSEALDVALCYGWIDGKASSATMPEGWWAQRYSPRRARSPWSQINCGRVEQLIAAGRMRPAGLAQVEQAKADGRWAAAVAPPSTAQTPPDLRVALDATPAAAAAFAALSRSNRYQILLDVERAKRPDTRARRIAGHVERLAAGPA